MFIENIYNHTRKYFFVIYKIRHLEVCRPFNKHVMLHCVSLKINSYVGTNNMVKNLKPTGETKHFVTIVALRKPCMKPRFVGL